jgi:hypothetical protein
LIIVGRRQIEALQAAMDLEFAQRALVVLKRVWSARLGPYDPDRLITWAADGVARARALDILTEQDVAGFLNLTLVLTNFALSFDLPDWAEAILSNAEAAPSDRLEAVHAAWQSRQVDD